MGEKIIFEDNKYYKFKQIKFKELTEGQIFLSKDGHLFIKSTYCNLIDRYATSISTGEYITFLANDQVYPVDCEITFKRKLQEVFDNE